MLRKEADQDMEAQREYSPANKVNIHAFNPKAINMQELYGFYKED